MMRARMRRAKSATARGAWSHNRSIEDALAAVLCVIGIVAYEGSAVGEFGDVLIVCGARGNHEIEPAHCPGDSGQSGLEAFHGSAVRLGQSLGLGKPAGVQNRGMSW